MRFHRIKAPELKELTKLVHTISIRVARFLERRRFLERNNEDSYLTLDCLDDGPMQQLHGHAITYRIANDRRISSNKKQQLANIRFFMMLHFMNYFERDDFNHGLIICIRLSGLVLFKHNFEFVINT